MRVEYTKRVFENPPVHFAFRQNNYFPMAGIFSDKALGSQFGDRVVWFVISSVDYIGQIISGKSVLGTSLRKRADQIDYIIINLSMDSSLVRAVIRPAFVFKSNTPFLAQSDPTG